MDATLQLPSATLRCLPQASRLQDRLRREQPPEKLHPGLPEHQLYDDGVRREVALTICDSHDRCKVAAVFVTALRTLGCLCVAGMLVNCGRACPRIVPGQINDSSLGDVEANAQNWALEKSRRERGPSLYGVAVGLQSPRPSPKCGRAEFLLERDIAPLFGDDVAGQRKMSQDPSGTWDILGTLRS